MWVTLKEENINFDLILKYRREDSNIILTDLERSTLIIYYPTAEKAKQVIKYLRKVLSVELGYTEEDKGT